ncbi:MAG: aminotransferase DegT [Burkholderiales bacterium]|jgi:dTDP-4-amino-4,6-dideoxygalactose transaminase|nr:aminotransferase DegT [Burkholderiales bacterium]
MILVTKTFLPERSSFDKYIDRIYASNWLTNFGQLEQELTDKLKDFLEVDNLLLTSNGSLAMQVVYKVLGLSGEVITTPFSFVATTSTLAWEKLTPIFADIDKNSLNLNPSLIEEKITHRTSAILPVHVYGRACEVDTIQKIADKHRLKLIYDAAHAFNVKTKLGKNILSYGDASTLSFHATKLFHTIEGGAIITQDRNLMKECRKLINFGITGYDQIKGLGTNSKMNEFCAAMGLAVLENIDFIISERERVDIIYRELLVARLLLQPNGFTNNNYSYFPILLKDETECLKVRDELVMEKIIPRRYFYPSLDTLDYVGEQYCPISRDIASRILCLPMYDSLTYVQIKKICTIVNSSLK